ncbi:MAG: NAD(P)-dependent oxidoreductase, partial [Bacteroidota bacterium]
PLTAEDIADTIYWAASRPAHVNISDVIITPTVQANATNTIRK